MNMLFMCYLCTLWPHDSGQTMNIHWQIREHTALISLLRTPEEIVLLLIFFFCLASISWKFVMQALLVRDQFLLKTQNNTISSELKKISTTKEKNSKRLVIKCRCHVDDSQILAKFAIVAPRCCFRARNVLLFVLVGPMRYYIVAG